MVGSRPIIPEQHQKLQMFDPDSVAFLTALSLQSLTSHFNCFSHWGKVAPLGSSEHLMTDYAGICPSHPAMGQLESQTHWEPLLLHVTLLSVCETPPCHVWCLSIAAHTMPNDKCMVHDGTHQWLPPETPDVCFLHVGRAAETLAYVTRYLQAVAMFRDYNNTSQTPDFTQVSDLSQLWVLFRAF